MAFFKLGLLAVFSVFVVSLSTTPDVYAQSPKSFGLTPQKTLPGSSGYIFKRIKEKTTEFFKFSKDSKYQYRKELLERRTSEYISLVEKKGQSQISEASQRIAFQAGILAESSLKESVEKKSEIVDLFEKYKPILGKMRDNFPANTPFWLLSQQDIDTMNILIEKLK